MTPYEGNEPYIFISYSHKDSEAVLSVIEALEKNGFRVWFDAGVEAGSEWPEYIASHLRKSACVLAFISPSFATSLNCRRELTFAQDLNVPMLNVYLESVELPDGLRMQLGLNQCLFKTKFKAEHEFVDALCRAELIQKCRAEYAESNISLSAVEESISHAEGAGKEMVSQHKARRKALAWITSIIEFSYAAVGAVAIDILSKRCESGLSLFLLMIIPHVALTLISLILYRTMGRKLTKQEKNEASTSTAAMWFFATIIAIIAGAFCVHSVDGGFMKFLVSLGLNLLPGILSMIFIGMLDE